MVGRMRPIEFQLLGITPPAWEPIDSLAVGRLLTWRLAENHQAELVRAALTAKFGEAMARHSDGRVSLVGAGDPADVRAGGRSATARRARSRRAEPPAGLEWLTSGARRGNSNNWVLAGGRTKGGRPILANDPHLQIEFPSVWYEMHLVAAGLDVIGVTIPGVPFVALGHNARIAWGMTATGADVQDLAIERVDVGKKRSMYRGEWVPIEIDHGRHSGARPQRAAAVRSVEDAATARSSPTSISIGKRRRRGCRPTVVPPRSGKAYSLRWDAGGDLATAFEAINRATDWTSFTDAIASFAVPSMNIVYADVDGNIGYAMSGKLPVRASGDGTMPADGNSAPAWTGSIEPGGAAAALQSAVGPDLFGQQRNRSQLQRPDHARLDGGLPRLAAARSAVEGARRRSRCDGGAAERSPQRSRRTRCWPALDDAIKTGASARRRSRHRRRCSSSSRNGIAWSTARPVVSLYEAFEDALWRRTFVDEMDEPLFLKFYEWAGAEKPAGLYSIIGDRNSPWFDDITTVEKKESRDDIFLLAIRDADEQLRRRLRRRVASAAGIACTRRGSAIRSATSRFRSAGSSAAARCRSRATARR